eukprot:6041568-Pyramimonas_sp.AAC.1
MDLSVVYATEMQSEKELSNEETIVETAYHDVNLAASIWNKEVSLAQKNGLPSCEDIFGVICEGTHPRTSCAHFAVRLSSDVGPEMNLNSCMSSCRWTATVAQAIQGC